MLAQGRRRKIMELVEQTGQVTIPDLVTRFSVSAVTARTDLDALSANGVVVRSHGGAVLYGPTQDYPLKLKSLKRAKPRSLTVITSALNIANELAAAPEISLIMLGGLLRTLAYSFVGPQAEATLRDLHADRLFLAVDAFDLEGGPSTPDVLEAQLNGLMMEVSKETTVVADSSKLGRRSLFRIGPIEKVHRLITDADAPKQFIDALRRKHVEVVVV